MSELLRTTLAGRRPALRELLGSDEMVLAPGCYDALSAKLVADAGYKVTFMSGFAVSAAPVKRSFPRIELGRCAT